MNSINDSNYFRTKRVIVIDKEQDQSNLVKNEHFRGKITAFSLEEDSQAIQEKVNTARVW